MARISKSRHRTLHSSISTLSKKRLKIYTLLEKAESAVTTQIRTGNISLADFLYQRRVPAVTSPACPCGWHRQTPEHVIMFCRLIDNREQMFRAAGTNNYQQLSETVKTLKILTAWLMKTGLLNSIHTGIHTIVQSTVVSLLFSFSSHTASQPSHASGSASPVRHRGVAIDRYHGIYGVVFTL